MSKNKKIKVEELKPMSRWITTPFLIILSAIFIITGIFVVNKANNEKQYYKETSAVIVSIGSYLNYDEDIDGKTSSKKNSEAYVTYTVDDITYTKVKLPYFDTGMKEGQTITITYDYRNPGKPVVSANTLYILGIISFIVGVLLIISMTAYSIMIVKRKKRERDRINKLISTGIVKRVSIDSILKSNNGQQFYCIVDGFDYSSPVIQPNPELYTGCTINIYFQKEGYDSRVSEDKWHSNYYLDLNSVEEGTYQEPKLL